MDNFGGRGKNFFDCNQSDLFWILSNLGFRLIFFRIRPTMFANDSSYLFKPQLNELANLSADQI
jgi:hypothetical protein